MKIFERASLESRSFETLFEYYSNGTLLMFVIIHIYSPDNRMVRGFGVLGFWGLIRRTSEQQAELDLARDQSQGKSDEQGRRHRRSTGRSQDDEEDLY